MLLLLVVGLVLAACSGQSSTGSTPTPASLVSPSVAPEDAGRSGPDGSAMSVPAQDGSSDEQPSDEQLNTILLQNGLLRQSLSKEEAFSYVAGEQERAVLVEDAIASCMRAEGFEYYPTPADELIAAFNDPEFEYGTREWSAYFGFGASTFIVFDDGSLPDGVVGYRGDRRNVRELDEDRNQQYLLTLDDAERVAYSIALNGGYATEEGEFVVSEGVDCRHREIGRAHV